MTGMKIRLIACDIDGTLLNPQGQLDPETITAVRACMEKGVRFVLSSGRMPTALRSIAEALNVNAPAVCFNGGAAVDLSNGKVLYSTPVPLQLSRKVAEAAEGLGLYMHAFIHGGYISPFYCEKTAAYEKLTGVKATVVNGPISHHIDEAPMKLLIIDTPEGAAKALDLLQERFGSEARFMLSQKHLIECVDKSTGKAKALEFLRQQMDIPPEATCSFGDGMNDIDMLSWSHISYVMENAPESVKKADNRFLRAPSNGQKGVARALNALMSSGMV